MGCSLLQADGDLAVRKQEHTVGEVRCVKARCVVALRHPTKKAQQHGSR